MKKLIASLALALALIVPGPTPAPASSAGCVSHYITGIVSSWAEVLTGTSSCNKKLIVHDASGTDKITTFVKATYRRRTGYSYVYYSGATYFWLQPSPTNVLLRLQVCIIFPYGNNPLVVACAPAMPFYLDH